MCELASYEGPFGLYSVLSGQLGAVLVLAGVIGPVRRLLQLAGADQVLRVFNTVAEAEAVFSG